MEHTKPYIDRTLRIFISYSSADKVLAGMVKANLDMYGFDTFVAHDNLEFGADWEKQIIRELESCDIFIPILSDNFKQSDWTSQEIGIAIELKKKILPLNAGINPYGFIRGIQAIRLTEQNIYVVTEEIINHLKEDEKYSKDLTDTVIRGLVNSGSFDSANTRARILSRFEIFNKDQVSEIARGYLVNGQITGGFSAKGIVEKIIKDNKDKIPPELFDEANL